MQQMEKLLIVDEYIIVMVRNNFYKFLIVDKDIRLVWLIVVFVQDIKFFGMFVMYLYNKELVFLWLKYIDRQ